MEQQPQTAADWQARLRGDHATARDHAAYEEWLEATPENRAEAESLDQIWQSMGALEEDPMVQSILAAPARPARPAARPWSFLSAPRLWGAALACMALVAASLVLWRQATAFDVHQTGNGEQRIVELADGSQLHLNVSTRLEVSLRGEQRTVRLAHGQAFFDVASDPERPFVVTAGDKEITVLGTKFAVLLNGEDTRVTVIEGRVAVTSRGLIEAGSPEIPEPVRSSQTPAEAENLDAPALTPIPHRIELTAQDAIAWTRNAPPNPLPSSDAVSSVENWMRGRVVFDNTPLEEAVVELDRYTPIRIKLASAELGATTISGVFHIERLADVDSLVFALENSLPIAVERNSDEILLLAI